MSLLVTAALLSSSALTLPACSWDRPGVEPYTGSLVESVDRYTDIPADVRATLKQRMAARQYDELVTIRRDAIVGRERYAPEIRDMHFGSGRVCRTVTRTQWASHQQERGLVYCAGDHCLLVPTVCRNLSRITRLPAQGTASTAGAGGAQGAGEGAPAGSAGGSGPTFAGGAGALPSVPGSAAPDTVGSLAAGPAWPAVATEAPDDGGVAAGHAALPLTAGSTLSSGSYPAAPPAPPLPAVPEAPVAALWLVGLIGLASAARARRAVP